jgi:hypothetical protein
MSSGAERSQMGIRCIVHLPGTSWYAGVVGGILTPSRWGVWVDSSGGGLYRGSSYVGVRLWRASPGS